MYRAQRISGHPISAIRISAFGGVRAPVTRVASAETIIRHSANAMYDGTSSRLNTSARTTGSGVVHVVSSIHARTTGEAARPQTTAWTVRIDASVQPTRHAAPAFERSRRSGVVVM